ncbi:MAG TPA: sporulation protein YpjB [Bacilli bacterium]
MFRATDRNVFFVKILILGAFLLLLLPVSPADAKPSAQSALLARLETAAENALDAAKAGSYPEALQQLDAYGELLTKIQFTGLTDAEGLKTLTAAWWDAKKIFTAARISRQESLAAAGRLRLATDALTHRKRPMWFGFANSFAGNLQEMEQAAKNSNAAAYKTNFAALRARFSAIRPAAIISGYKLPVYQIDSILVFVDSELNRSNPDMRKLSEMNDRLRETFAALFAGEDRQAFLHAAQARHPLAWTLAIGVLIVSVLAFVGWKKFKYGRPYTTIRF